ncbi:MAG: hypothetical protein HYV03_00210 [Deltaproteobacteria bacterium]|nr:hypothetical protein [Deltaproteobacteria bacterium]
MGGTSPEIVEVRNWRARRLFLRLPWRLYRHDPAWVAPLRIELARRIDPRKNPYFRHGEAALFLARAGREVVGRISAQVERAASEGAFGFYEAVDDQTVADTLLGAASEWLRRRGVGKVMGPCNFRLEDPAPGFLTRGFDLPPAFMMAYSKPHYPSQLERAGFTTVMDLHSYCVDKEHPLPQGLLDRADQAAAIPGLRIRQLQMERLFDEAELLRGIFNGALKNNWGFVPFSAAQARQMARDLKMLADPRIVLIAEVENRPIGAVINLPNYNDILADCNGRLFPKGLYRLWRCRHRIRGLRGYAMGILPDYQGHGVGCLLIREAHTRGMAAGYTYGEITWVLGSNKGMNELAQYLGGQQQKGYRLYQRTL